MTCPKCQAEFETPAGPANANRKRSICPVCGVRLLRSVTGVVRTSAVLISTGDQEAFYDSLQDVPEHLRDRLVESTNSDNSGTIVIADRAGRERLTEVLARRENRRRSRRPARRPRGAFALAPERLAEESNPESTAGKDIELREQTDNEIGGQAHSGFRARTWIPWLAVLIILVAAGLLSAWFGLRW